MAKVPDELQTQKPKITIHVNPEHKLASDKNIGTTSAKPIRTIQKGVNLAKSFIKKNLSVKLLVYPGLYREHIQIVFKKFSTNALLTVEAKEPGKTIVRGSDVFKEWQKSKGSDVYVHSWLQQWGETPFPKRWPKRLDRDPLLKRREMVFVNGKPLRQVHSSQGLDRGTFFVSENERKISIVPHIGQLLSTSLVEVAVRPKLLSVRGKTNIIVRGFVFEHASSPLQNGAVSFLKVRNLLLEDCVFRWNNWAGYQLHQVENVTGRRNKGIYNGGAGIVGSNIKELLSEDEVTSYNNWRGAQAGFYFWAVGGAKYLHVHNAVFRRQQSMNNHAAGFWLDTDNENIILENNTWCGNFKEGLVIEASQGPILISHSKIYQNEWTGIHISGSKNSTLTGNQIYNNTGAQIKIEGSKLRKGKNWETRTSFTVKGGNWKFENNIIRSENLLLNADSQHFIATLKSTKNHWHSLNESGWFRVQKKVLDLNDWRNQFNSDERLSLTDQSSFAKDCQYAQN
ncbi:MAG: hypothetical protein NPIRA04_22400 [Nitrospirales bacterium]|nr:MAG: hypothetical protein NPIRA04_22400 [Nitrospirales bacterium]